MAQKLCDERFVLAQGDAGKPPNSKIHRAGHGEARARDRCVMRPWVVFKRIEQRRKFREQCFIHALATPPQVKRFRQIVALFIERETSENRVGAGVDRGQIIGNPASGDLAVCIGGKDKAVISPAFRQPRFGEIHRRASGIPGIGNFGGQNDFDDVKRERQALGHRPRNRRALIRAIIGEEDNAEVIPGESATGDILLGGESREACWQSLLFVSDRYCNRASNRRRWPRLLWKRTLPPFRTMYPAVPIAKRTPALH
jgi:hypothetical protein